MLNKSLLIVAHPDDDVLWFSSILNDVDNILFCFSDYTPIPTLGANRKKVISEYPLKNISSLALQEPQSFNMADWLQPTLSEYGIQLVKSKEAETRYRQTYSQLRERLLNKLIGIKNVFTHNPWGEYGHEDHILVYRIIKDIQPLLGFNIWYSNYCSNRSYPLLIKHISGFSSDYKTLATNHKLAKEIANIYKKHNCWTWYDDYKWFNEECFIKDADLPAGLDYGHLFPINLIKTDITSEPDCSPFRTFMAKYLAKININ